MSRDIILEKQDYTHLSWSKVRNSSGTAGSFLKSCSVLGGVKTYYKLSDYDTVNGIVGHECVNELIVDRLLDIFGIEHLKYQLIHADVMINEKRQETFFCASADFKEPGEDKLALDAFYDIEREKGESIFDFCVRNNWENYIYEMLVVDFIVLNRDRHGANIEVLRNRRKKTLRLAPLFDHGISLLCRCHTEEEIDGFDVMEDKKTNSFIGSFSTKENLKLIPRDKLPKLNPLTKADKKIIFDGLDSVISGALIEKIWEMIWKRWCYYEDFCHS